MRAFKVLSRCGTELYSAVEGKSKNFCSIRYYKNKKTYPRKGTRIFVFSSLDDAKNYARVFNFEIWEVEVTKLFDAPKYYREYWDYRNMWRNGNLISENSGNVLPDGTKLASWVKLLKKV